MPWHDVAEGGAPSSVQAIDRMPASRPSRPPACRRIGSPPPPQLASDEARIIAPKPVVVLAARILQEECTTMAPEQDDTLRVGAIGDPPHLVPVKKITVA